MPSHQRPKYDWPIRLTLRVTGKKPRLADWPGLDTDAIVRSRLPDGVLLWQFCLFGRYAN